MRQGRKARAALLAVSTCTLLAGAAGAQPVSWTFTNGGSWTASWTTASNWTPQGVPNSNTANVFFPAGPVSGGSGTITLNNARTAGTVHFAASGYTIAGTGTLTLAISSSGDGFIDVASGATGTISTVLSLGGSTRNLVKVGAGMVVLNGAAAGSVSLDYGLDIRDGTVRVGNATFLNPYQIVATSGNGQFDLAGAGTGGTVIFGAGTAPVGGTIVASSGNNVWTGPWFVTTNNASVGVASGATMTLNGSLVDGSGTIQNGFTKLGAGLFSLPKVSLFGPFTIDSGTVRVNSNGTNTATSVVPLLTIPGASPQGRFDLTDNKLVIRNGNVDLVHGYLAAGRASGNWSGNGISSSVAQADAAAHGGQTTKAVGYALGNQLASFNGSTATFGGLTLTAADVAIAYTVDGDTNLDGIVDLNTDFDHLLTGLGGNSLVGGNATWFGGDFDFNGTVDIPGDFAEFAAGFYAQGGSLPALNAAISNSGLSGADQEAMHSIVAQTPEPASTWIALLVTAGALARRRSRGS